MTKEDYSKIVSVKLTEHELYLYEKLINEHNINTNDIFINGINHIGGNSK